MPAATVNDIQLAYVEQGRGQPVVFVHGGLGDYRHFAGQMAAFAERHRAIAVSCRGYWPNEPLRPGEEITLDTFVNDIAAFITSLDAAPVHLVGHSSPGGFGSLPRRAALPGTAAVAGAARAARIPAARSQHPAHSVAADQAVVS